MKIKQLKEVLLCTMLIVSMLLYSEISFGIANSGKCSPEDNRAQFTTGNFQYGALVNNQPPNAPAPTITDLTHGSFGSVFKNKLLSMGISGTSWFSFFNFYHKKTTQNEFPLTRILLSFCILRI